MKTLMTQGEVCERLRIKYGKLNKMLNANEFVVPVYGRGKKLVFDPDAVEAWIKARQARQQPVTPTDSTPAQQRRKAKAFRERQAAADAALQRHANNR